MAEPRIKPVTTPTPEAAETLAKLGTVDGRPLNIFGTLAHHPQLLRRYIALGGVFLSSIQLPARERELVILRVAWRTRALYEFGHHTRMGLAAGLTNAEIDRVVVAELGGWPAADAMLLRAADELQADDRVGDPTWALLAERYSEAELLELLGLIGFYRMTAGLLNSTGVEPEASLAGWPATAELGR
jgi:4-carboxymuconolactone decarboxylase